LALVAYVNRIFPALFGIPAIRLEAAPYRAAFERVFELLDHDPPPGREGGRPERVVRPAEGDPPLLSLEGVWFRYPSAADVMLPSLVPEVPPAPGGWVLRGVDLAVPRGHMLALVGPSGAGKSTVAGLAARLYDPVRGAVRFDGTDVWTLDPDDYAARLGVVTQDTFLFHDTVRANVLFGRPDASEAEVIEACRAAHIHDFLSSLPEGYDTIVGEHGFRLSGGEKQRVGIARMVLKDPELLLLDEATAHLDSGSERLVQRALAEVLRGRTSVVIAHRLSTVRRADEIAVIEGGVVAERGTHDSLVAAGGRYTELHRLSVAHDAMADQQ
jgi:ATP-binding cassette subfamily B protein